MNQEFEPTVRLKRTAIAKSAAIALTALFIAVCLATSAHTRQETAPNPIDLPAESVGAIDTICTNLATQIQKRHFVSVAVFGASWSRGDYTELGSALGDLVSSRLAAKVSGFDLIDRSQLRAKLEADRMSPLMALPSESAAWLAADLKIRGVVVVTLDNPKARSITAHILLRDPARARIPSLVEWKLELPLSLQASQSLHRSLLTDDLIAKPGTRHPDPGATSPECTYCPRPDYTKDAQDAKWRGGASLSALITPKGVATDILLLEYAPYEMDHAFVNSVKTWKFKPALDPNKVPVPERIQIATRYEIF